MRFLPLTQTHSALTMPPSAAPAARSTRPALLIQPLIGMMLRPRRLSGFHNILSGVLAFACRPVNAAIDAIGFIMEMGSMRGLARFGLAMAAGAVIQAVFVAVAEALAPSSAP